MAASALEKRQMYITARMQMVTRGQWRFTRRPFLSLRTGIDMWLANSDFVMDIANTTPERWLRPGRRRKCETLRECSMRISLAQNRSFFAVMFSSWASLGWMAGQLLYSRMSRCRNLKLENCTSSAFRSYETSTGNAVLFTPIWASLTCYTVEISCMWLMFRSLWSTIIHTP